MEIIRVSDVYYEYENPDDTADVAVKGVSLSVEKGEWLSIIGHNGSGKSTLVKLLNGLYLPRSGTVLVDNIDTRDEQRIWDVRQKVGMIFQNPDNQMVATIVEEDVAFAPENLGVPPEEIRRRVDEALKLVGMYEYRDHAPHLLSGGQKQRIAIAGVIAMRPRCIVLDEPTAMLDPQGRREVLETVMRLNRESGITVVLITHHMREAALAGRVIAMSDGGILADGTPKEVFRQVELLRSAGLNVPETTQLLYELNKSGLHLPLEALSVEECAEALYHDLKDSGGTPQ